MSQPTRGVSLHIRHYLLKQNIAYLTTVTKTLVPKTCPAFKKEAPKLKNNRDYANPQPSKHRCTVMFTATRKSRRNRSDITAERNESLTPQIFFADCFQTGNLRSAVLTPIDHFRHIRQSREHLRRRFKETVVSAAPRSLHNPKSKRDGPSARLLAVGTRAK